MIAHNEPLEDKLLTMLQVLSDKAVEYNDFELKQLREDFDWMIVEHNLYKRETKENSDATYYRGYKDGYEDAKEVMLNAL